MLELVSVLMNLLIVEGTLLIALNLFILGLILKKMHKNEESSINKFKENVLSFKLKVYSNEQYSNICKAAVVLYGVLKLTAMWCFSILLGMILTPKIWGVIMFLIMEIVLVAIQVRNKFVLNSDDIIDLKWIVLKIERIIQKKYPTFTYENAYKEIKKYAMKVVRQVEGYLKKVNNSK